MDKKRFTFWNRIIALTVFIISSVVYLLTIEPTASFWDCGEFIASSYKLEVGHPPGNPVFQIFARLATMFTDNMHAAMAVNAMNAICSSLTILLLYLTIVFLVRRIMKPSEKGGDYSLSQSIAIMGSGAVGALAYAFTDTFWFSAVEGEVYAMSSLFTAFVFWAMTKWYEQADQPYANRWIVLISFAMGLSIGIHLLNLLTIPALVFMFYYKQKEDSSYNFWGFMKIFMIAVLLVAVLFYGIIPYLPKVAAFVDRIFVNGFGLPFNSGAAFFMVALLGLCFWGLFDTLKKNRVFMNTLLLCFTMVIIGFSVFTVVIIRSSAKTPTNEYQPDNPYTLVRYLGREQYGKNPLIYGHTFDAPYDIESEEYWAPLGDEYIKAPGPGNIQYDAAGKMLFPRMYSSDGRHKDFYRIYMYEGGKKIVYGQDYNGKPLSFEKPTMIQNLRYFFDYQMNWMYWRYFMWNFAGRQNDIHSPVPGDVYVGNWESGIGFIDDIRLGDQSDAPGYLKDNKGKNHYYMLPLLLGILGICFQFSRDQRGFWVTFLMFFMTGIAIVMYLNQPPYQVRERDYAYAGSFYSFSIWIGLAVVALYTWIQEFIEEKFSDKKVNKTAVSAVLVLVTLQVPVLMAAENWDDHDRSNRYTAVEMAKNYLNSVGQNGILVTHGDNDTFPLWYAQEVENVRPDVRIANTSLLGTDWHIEQMTYAVNESAPLKLNLDKRDYLYGTNEAIHIYRENDTLPLVEVIERFKDKNRRLFVAEGQIVSTTADNPNIKYLKQYGIDVSDYGDFICAGSFTIPVNKENVIKYGILDEKYADMIPEEITLSMPKDKYYLTKPELFMLDFLSTYEWDRPLNLLSMGGDIEIGIKEYFMYDGFSYRFVPIKNKMSSREIGFSDPDDLYHKMKNVYQWDALSRTDWFVDYQNFYTFCGVLPMRQIFTNVAGELMEAKDTVRAVEILDMCQECIPEANFPLDAVGYSVGGETSVLAMIEMYYSAGEYDKFYEMSQRFVSQLLESQAFFAKGEYSTDYLELCDAYIIETAYLVLDYVTDLVGVDGYDKEKAAGILDECSSWVSEEVYPGDYIFYRLAALYQYIGMNDKAEEISIEYLDTLCRMLEYYAKDIERFDSEIEYTVAKIYDLNDFSESAGFETVLAKIEENFSDMLEE